MSFQSQNEAAFDFALNVFKSDDTGSCTMRLPVNRDGTDAFGAKDYDCIQAPSPDTMTLVAGGFLNDYQFSVTCRKTDFTTPPIPGTLLIRNGRVSRILTLEDAGAGVDVSPILYMHCGTPDK
jgi:hypothetical protein